MTLVVRPTFPIPELRLESIDRLCLTSSLSLLIMLWPMLPSPVIWQRTLPRIDLPRHESIVVETLGARNVRNIVRNRRRLLETSTVSRCGLIYRRCVTCEWTLLLQTLPTMSSVTLALRVPPRTFRNTDCDVLPTLSRLWNLLKKPPTIPCVTSAPMLESCVTPLSRCIILLWSSPRTIAVVVLLFRYSSRTVVRLRQSPSPPAANLSTVGDLPLENPGHVTGAVYG